MAKIKVNIPSVLKLKLKSKCSEFEIEAGNIDELIKKCQDLFGKNIVERCIFYLNNQKINNNEINNFQNNDEVNIIFMVAGG